MAWIWLCQWPRKLQFSQTKYYLYSYSGEFLRLNTTGKFFWVLLIFCWALILLMNGPQSLINGHIKICHSTFTFLMTGSTNPLKKCVREWFSLSTWHCQNYFVRQNCNLSSYTRVTSGGSYGLEAVCICNWLQSSEDSANLASPCEPQNWSWRPSFWEAHQNLYLYIVFDHFWEANWY